MFARLGNLLLYSRSTTQCQRFAHHSGGDIPLVLDNSVGHKITGFRAVESDTSDDSSLGTRGMLIY